MKQLLLALVASLMLLGCQTIPNHVFDEETYDFDHKLRFRQDKLEGGSYLLSIRAVPETSFYRMSAFMMRQALLICGSYDFKMQIKSGIPYFGERRANPNLIFSDLVAEVECPDGSNEVVAKKKG